MQFCSALKMFLLQRQIYQGQQKLWGAPCNEHLQDWSENLMEPNRSKLNCCISQDFFIISMTSKQKCLGFWSIFDHFSSGPGYVKDQKPLDLQRPLLEKNTQPTNTNLDYCLSPWSTVHSHYCSGNFPFIQNFIKSMQMCYLRQSEI